MDVEQNIKYKYRGMVIPEKIISNIKAGDYDFVHTQKQGYNFSYQTDTFQFHVVDRFASFPLFYCIVDGLPYVSENVEELIPRLDVVKFDPVGYYTTGWLFKGERTELTPIKCIKRIMPGHYLEYKDNKINIVQYWSFFNLRDKPFTGTEEEAAEKLGFLINKAVKRCYHFDDNCAIHLSGGIDSGVIASLYASYSNNDVQAYLFKEQMDSMQEEGTESSFAQKYQSNYPNIRLKVYDFALPSTNIDYSISNWHAIQSASHEEFQISEVAKLGHSFVLTGLGGDELASYRVSSKVSDQYIDNDRQAKDLLKNRNGIKLRLKEFIKILIGKKGNLLQALRKYSSRKYFSDNRFWYTKEFRKLNKHLMSKPPMTPVFYPSTLEYRLEVLSRSWFTIRSDRWNYLGAQYGVDFIHPLLDVDLVDFAATIPSELLLSLPQRELFKRALENYVPDELLEGVKRVGYSTTTENISHLEDQLRYLLNQTYKLEKSFASSVFDIYVLQKQIKQNLKKLYYFDKSKEHNDTTVLHSNIAIFNTIIRNCKYLQGLESVLNK